MKGNLDLTEEYEELEESIIAICRGWTTHRGGEYDELIQETFLYFHDAFYRFNGEGDWKKWIIYRMKMNLLEQARRLKSRQARHSYGNTESLLCWDNPSILDSMSERALLVAKLTINPPKKVKQQIVERGGAVNNIRSVIRVYLMDLGWSAKQVREVYQEIYEVLRDR